jgi:hypothetical protein
MNTTQDLRHEQNEDDQPSETLRNQFLNTLLAKRKEAIAGRAASGIEIEWQEDEEHYQGVDDANRAFQSAGRMSQPKRWATTGRTAMDKGPVRSVVFLNITRPYVDAASARVADMLLPTDDRAWEIKPTPIPRLSAGDIAQMGGSDAVNQLIEQAKEIAKDSADRMQEEIDDCLVESGWHGEVRRVIEDSARLGSGVLKGPVPIKRSVKMAQRNESGLTDYVNLSEIRPGSKRIDPWNLFPDPACGDNIHNGAYIWEREYLSSRQLREMLAMPGYDVQEIAKAIKEGPSLNSAREAPDGAALRQDDQFEMWIFHGYGDSEQLEALGVDCDDEADKLPAMAVFINDRLVKVTLSALDSGDFPYDVLAWQGRPGMPWGMGVARQIRTVQRILNGAVRAMMDNSGLSAAPQIILGNGVTPDDGMWTLRGGKLWRMEPSADVADARAAFSAFVVPSVQNEMMNIINFALKMAEDTTGLPAMLQGIKGDAPDTLGGMQMQNNNATSVLRRLAKRFDDYMTRPHIQRYFDWMMQHSDDEEIKGDFDIEVRASSALVERDAQQQFLLQMAQLARDPQFGIDPARLFAELAKGQRLDPKRFQFTEEERAQQAQAQQAPQDPVATAKAGLLEAQAKETMAKMATKNVEGMFSATEAAKNVAMVPQIAGVADAMWQSAGGQDQNEAPAIPDATGIQALPPETNTNPLTPANPTSPLLGFRAGIEGGQS